MAMEIKANYACFCLVLMLACFVSLSSGCAYEIKVVTGDGTDAGTKAKVSLKMMDRSGLVVVDRADLPTIAEPTNPPYFEPGNTDTFVDIHDSGECKKICHLTLSHDNSATDPSWLVESVSVTGYPPGVAIGYGAAAQYPHKFELHRWLADNHQPYSLSTNLDDCDV